MVASLSIVVIEPRRSDSFARRNVLKAIRENHGDDSDQHPREAVRGSHFFKRVSITPSPDTSKPVGRCPGCAAEHATETTCRRRDRTMFVGGNRLVELSGSVTRGIGFQPVFSSDRLEAYPTEFGNLLFCTGRDVRFS
jgi:hypothetical protein